MAETQRCPQCGGPLSGDSVSGVCPACLLEQGLPGHSAAVSERGLLATLTHVQPLAATGHTQPNSPQLPRPGDEFGGYRIMRKLGHGGMGTVFEAEHLDSGRRVALKLLSHSLDSPEARKRFFREGRLAASVNHPHSVYVYGTEEINGTPAISMELVAGGTLQERVKQKGPLPIAEAVDVVLQVVAGLEAAQSLGVLHRDVKPSNCFVDMDGSVKVGDFGLSISTTVRGESHLTSSGAFLGTPAFSSPEQLKGDELDVRSDIYAVGVTLYYLLTGRTPFEADNLVKLLAIVLEQSPPSPAKWRSEIPGDLARTVLRCLEKQPAQRYKNYSELRAALQPFSSEMPTPARLPIRFMAGAIDMVAVGAASMLQTGILYMFGLNMFEPDIIRRPQYAWLFLCNLIFLLFYYAVPEGLWGASFGKWLCGLRVVNASRNSPGVFWAAVRMVIYVFLPVLPMWIGMLLNPTHLFSGDLKNLPFLFSMYPLLALMFSTARRRNGYAGLHDLASRTRVIIRPVYKERPRLAVVEEQPATPGGTQQVGPYHILESLGQSGNAEWLLAYDTRLLRKVWIRRLPAGAPPVSPALRNVARSGRLRWLGGKRATEECWDAFEASAGTSLLALLDRPQPWGRVRYWLFDLAQELAAGLKDQTLPAELGLDRVWITNDGRAKLLDFPAPGITTSAKDGTLTTELGEVGPTRQFLYQVALAALTGRQMSATEAAQERIERPLPLHALSLVQSLLHVQRPEVVAAQLQPVLHKPDSVSRRRRIALLVGCVLLPALASTLPVVFRFVTRYGASQMPTILPLHACLWLYTPFVGVKTAIATKPEERAALETYIAGRFGPTIRDPKVWSSFYARSTIPQWEREAAERIVATRPQPTEAEVEQAEKVVKPLLETSRVTRPFETMPLGFLVPMFFGVALVMYVAFPSLIAAVLFRGGLLLAVLGIAVVTRTGQRVSRGRMLWRALLAWSPLLAAPIWIALLAPLEGAATYFALLGACYLVVVIWSVLLPGRGLQDRLAGTYLVPR